MIHSTSAFNWVYTMSIRNVLVVNTSCNCLDSLETNELLYVYPSMWFQLKLSRESSVFICLKYGEVIQCVIFPDFIWTSLCWNEYREINILKLYPSLQARFMFADSTINALLLWRRRNYSCIAVRRLNSIQTLPNDDLTFVSVIYFLWTELRYCAGQTKTVFFAIRIPSKKKY